MNLKLPGLIALFAGAVLAAGTYPAAAQEYPSKPIRIIIAYGAGSGLDGLMRQMAQEISANWKQPVLVENRPGASGIIAGEACRKSAADGYTVCMFNRSFLSLPLLIRNVSFDPVKDFKPITKLVDLIQVIVAHPGLGAASMKDMFAIAKAKPGVLNYASLGPGSGIHLFFEWIKKEHGLDLIHVPYKNPTDLVQTTVTGQTSVTMFGALNFIPLIRAGKVKALALSSRTQMLPDVPTLVEQGISIDASNWFGYFAPAGTPSEIVRKLRDEVARIYAIPAFREKNLIQQALLPVVNTPEEFARSLPADVAQGAELIKLSGAGLE